MVTCELEYKGRENRIEIAGLHFVFLVVIPLMIWITRPSLAHTYQDGGSIFSPHVKLFTDIHIGFLLILLFSVEVILKCYSSPQWISMNAPSGIGVRDYHHSFVPPDCDSRRRHWERTQAKKQDMN